jgi:hypothetical protein
MKTSVSLRAPRLVAILAFAFASFTVSNLSAQNTTVTTAPVGALGYNFNTGTQLSGISLMKPAVFSGAVTAVSGANLVSGTSDVGSLLTTGVTYFVEFSKDTANTGLYEGDRFDVDVASTKVAAAGTIVLATAKLENTVSGNPPAALVGANFVIRPHYTLGALLTDMPAAFVAGDKINIRKDGGSTVTVTLNAAKTIWQAGIANNNATIVYPGVGFFFVRAAASATTGTIVGDVRTNTFVQLIKSGSQVLSEGFPVDSAPSPTTLGAPNRFFTNTTVGNVFTGGVDKMYAYNASNVLTAYTYNSSTNRWNAGIANGNAVNLFKADKGVYLTTGTVNNAYIQTLPFTL